MAWFKVSRSTIDRALKRLEARKLAFRNGRVWFKVDGIDLDALPEAVRAGEYRATQQARYAKEREDFLRWLEGCRQRGTDPYYRPRTVVPSVRPELPTGSDIVTARRTLLRDEDMEESPVRSGPSIREYYARMEASA